MAGMSEFIENLRKFFAGETNQKQTETKSSKLPEFIDAEPGYGGRVFLHQTQRVGMAPGQAEARASNAARQNIVYGKGNGEYKVAHLIIPSQHLPYKRGDKQMRILGLETQDGMSYDAKGAKKFVDNLIKNGYNVEISEDIVQDINDRKINYGL